MDFIKAQLERIQKQLAGLTVTQKMLTATLVAIMAITVVWWGKYAGDSEVVPLLNQSFSVDEMGRMQNVLSDHGIHTDIATDKLMIRSDLRLNALSALTAAKAIPKMTDDGIKDVLTQSTPWNSDSKDNRLWNRAKQQFLSNIITNIPDVATADVIIDPQRLRQIGSDVTPTASVAITMIDGKKPTGKLVDGVAQLLKGAQAGLSLDHITVVVNGQPQRVHDPDKDDLQYASGDAFELRQHWETYEEAKVKERYRYIPGLQVKVTVQVNTTSTQTDKREVDPKAVISKPTRSSEDTEESNSAAPPTGEAGTVPNTALAATPPPAASPSQTQTHTHTETEFQNVVPETHIVSHTPAGDVKVVGASVAIPISFYVASFKLNNPTITTPTPVQLNPYIAVREKEIHKAIADMLVMADPEKLAMDWWPDVGEETAPPQLAPAGSVANMTGFVGLHFKELALGGLAVMSLFMASMMVRKSGPTVVPMAQSSQMQMPSQLLAGEMLAGEASSSSGTLDGMELNEDTIKSQQMVEQVSTLVRENPDAAASLVKRWLNRT